MSAVAGDRRLRPDVALAALGVAAAAGLLAGLSPLAAAAVTAVLLSLTLSVSLPPVAAASLLVGASFLSAFALPVAGLHVRPEQAIGPLLLAGLLLRRRAGPVPREALLVVLWIATGVFAAFGEPDDGRAFAHAARLLATCLPLVLLPALLEDEGDARRAWNVALLFSVLEAAYGLLAWASHRRFGTSFGITREYWIGIDHPHGTLLEPNLLGALSAAAAVPLLLRAASRRTPSRERLLAALGAVVLLGALAVSLTRAAWLALPAALALVLVIRTPGPSRSGSRLPRVLAALAFACALGIALVVLTPASDVRALREARTGVAGKIAALTRMEDDPNVRVRLRTYDAALAVWRARPLLGAGHGAMERIPGRENARLAWAGNLEVHLLADTGLAGLALLGAFVFVVLARLVRTARRSPDDAARSAALERIGALLVLLFAAQATESTWLASFWVFFGLALAARPRERAAAARPLRILYVHPSDELYGSDRVLLDLVRRLDRGRHEPRVLLSRDVPYAGRLSRRLVEMGVPVRHLRIGVLRRRVLGSPLRLARYAADVSVSTVRIAALLRRERIDIVHANTVTVFPAAFAAALAGKRLVWHVHEIVTDRPGRRALLSLVRLLADRLVVVSEAARDALGPARRGAFLDVIPNGVEERPRPGPPADPPVIAYIGRLSRRKGPDVLVRAAGLLAAAHPNVRFVFAGDEFGGGDELTRELTSLAGSLGIGPRVEFRPFREDVSDLLAEATAVVSPSILPESFGLVLLEAMAAGRAVVASDLGGPRELVVDGETGYLVPPGDAAALAEALSRLLADPALALRLGEAGRRRALERFALARSVARFEAIYRALAR